MLAQNEARRTGFAVRPIRFEKRFLYSASISSHGMMAANRTQRLSLRKLPPKGT